MAQTFEHFSFENLIDETALFSENAFNRLAGKIPEYNAVPTDPQAVIASQLFAQGPFRPAVSFEGSDRKLDSTPAFRRQAFKKILNLLAKLNPKSHSAMSSSE